MIFTPQTFPRALHKINCPGANCPAENCLGRGIGPGTWGTVQEPLYTLFIRWQHLISSFIYGSMLIFIEWKEYFFYFRDREKYSISWRFGILCRFSMRALHCSNYAQSHVPCHVQLLDILNFIFKTVPQNFDTFTDKFPHSLFW